MKRYLVFKFYDYYPGGGWNDFKGSFDSLEEAIQEAKVDRKDYDYCQIVDINDGSVVEA